MFKPVSSQINLPELEERVLSYWKENKIFEKSVKKDAPNGNWTFLDGPPFVTGLPHYGHLLTSIAKDLFPRFWTMKGYSVRRVWGWDGHGLPIENKVENKLAIKRKKDIEEKIGVKRFIDLCKEYVNEVSDEWEWYIDHIARWVDFKHAYKTWDLPYMESVLWVFKQMYEKGYIYKGLRVSLYCPHCSTPISNFEVAMDPDNYKDLSDTAATYKYKLKEEKDTYILAWSTTPWNKIVTPALAVNPDFEYVKVKQGDEQYILAKTTLKTLKTDIPYKIIETFLGKELLGKKFEPHYNYYPLEKGEKAFEIVGGDFVTAEEGTGVVTIAAYGEEDLKVMQEQNVHIEMHLDEEGVIKENVPLFGGMYYLKANKAVNEDLAKRNLLYHQYEYTHSVPTCWRCHTRLYYAPQNAWFVDVQSLKDTMKAINEKVSWYPKHFKYGRFLKSLESAPDWCISRNRYWGSPVPVWECVCGERIVIGSLKELEELSGTKIQDLHKPGIDEIRIKCSKCEKLADRVPEVLDSWIEAGSASFAERHFPFEGNLNLEDFFPPDFIVEYTGQIRAWFYVLHVISSAIYGSAAFKNVLVNGVILGTDGRKMSKNFGNYPDPKELLQKYGGDGLRLYLMGSPVMHGEDIIISEEKYREQLRGLLLIYWNVHNFFTSNALYDNWSPQQVTPSPFVLDKWITSRLNNTIISMTKSYEQYDTPKLVELANDFVNDLSLWYVRRSRERMGASSDNKEDKNYAYSTLWTVLRDSCKLFAPLIPFITEEIYRNITQEESVHLTSWWQKVDVLEVDSSLEKEMQQARELASKVNAFRKESGVKVRIPFKQLEYKGSHALTGETLKIVLEEVNVYELSYIGKKDEYEITGDTSETNQDEEAGKAREIIRSIQQERKRLGTDLQEQVKVTIDNWPQKYEAEIKRKAGVSILTAGSEFRVEKT